VRLREDRCQTPLEFKAWSQNLAHEQVLTTFCSYGTVPAHRQEEIFSSMRVVPGSQRASSGNAGVPDSDTIRRVLEHVAKSL
jgi:hypothetical protein